MTSPADHLRNLEMLVVTQTPILPPCVAPIMKAVNHFPRYFENNILIENKLGARRGFEPTLLRPSFSLKISNV